MFELPTVPQMMECKHQESEDFMPRERLLVNVVQRAIDAGLYDIRNAEIGALIAWGQIHGLTSLYLSGHLSKTVTTNEGFLELVETAMDSLGSGWVPRETPGRAGS
jgi:hypothetical protein